jgi:hypothetical protein
MPERSDPVADDLKPRRRRVERVEDWDDARYAVTPPRAALDQRLTLIHFRLMTMLGRVNTRQGWCEMSQTKFAAALGYSRGSVVRAVGELVDWRYVEKRGQEASGSALCHYRLLIDEPETEDDDGAAEAMTPAAAQVAVPPLAASENGTCHVPRDTPTCHLPRDTGVTSHVTEVSRRKHTTLDQRSEITPPPPDGGKREGKPSDGSEGQADGSPDRPARRRSGPDWDRLLALARTGDPARDLALDVLVAPVVAQRRLDAPVASVAVRAIASHVATRGLTERQLAAAARFLLETRKATVKPSDFDLALDQGVVKMAEKITIRRGTPEWEAWAGHLRRTRPSMAAHMDGCGTWFVDSPFPPQPQSSAGGRS